ncbi:FAD/FMN-containing isoamyl alcohol oxidase-like protein MreA [Massarina eburnea CBS 473.64]|uniref:FAD/FMN-containing isoamyl alcohol oxidase-like protein MreA n=1 Tax=Massarina eburnea CBS 473.64 TaxID=1395130 RepID=A0A6A6SC85_9PLEO|nr:FAD/FMN-containing isoamyl alcohol oxidase-like protein MreA [Massarina eburnea CBS 473.64]
MLFSLRSFCCLAIVAHLASAYNFPYEVIQLKDSDVTGNPDIAFGQLPSGIQAKCKTFPGDSNWPSEKRWAAFNTSLGGALTQNPPPVATCYEGPFQDAAKCDAAIKGSSSSLFAKENPLIPFQMWTLGNPCPIPAANNVNKFCNISSFPVYVVDATTVKHIQLAINFARNNNIRLTIKNTGHDFVGRNTGGGALQVWVHHLKAFEYLTTFQIAGYDGKAARVGAALEQYDLLGYMDASNVTLLTPGSSTVGAYGGFMQGGGFGYATSKFGLMADQVIAVEVVTADGRFVHADLKENEDLFWAIRGGGPGNFGIVTSAVVKAHDPVSFATWSFNFGTEIVGGNTTTSIQVSTDVFWKGVSAYFSHLVRINDANGIGWNSIGTTAPTSFNPRGFSFTGQVMMPAMASDEFRNFMAPMVTDLNDLGINITNPVPKWFESFPKSQYRAKGPGENVGNIRMVSRLWPRSIFEDTSSQKFTTAMAAIRSFVEDGGYSFHSVDYHPSNKVAGFPGTHSAVNPHLRTAIMHSTGFDTVSHGPDSTDEQQIAGHMRLRQYAQKWIDATPGSGSYMNEGDTEEPEFQKRLYGSNYERLYEIKKNRDPWGLFYVVTGVASDEWVVEGSRDGLPTQQGRLCRV